VEGPLSESAQGPGWWVASDGRWYPPEQAGGYAQPVPVPQPRNPERTRSRSILNFVLLFGTAAALSIGVGFLFDAVEDTGNSRTDPFAEQCSIERARLVDAVDRTHAELGRYLDVEELIFVGELDTVPDHHDVQLEGPSGAPTAYSIIESPACARTHD
jgi:hypothetical protein